MPRFELDILVHSKDVTKYMHEGRLFVEGRAGSEFTIRVRNHGPGRVLAVVSVDGLSVMDGKPAGTDKGGYVLGPFGMLDIPGWRLDNDDVARFAFEGKKGSYAAAKGADKRNIGVIGCAFFEENVQRYRSRGILRSHTSITCDSYGDAPVDDMLFGNERGAGPMHAYSVNAAPGSAPVADDSTFEVHTSDCAAPARTFDSGQRRRLVPSSVGRRKKGGRKKTKKGARPMQNIGTAFGQQASHRVVDVEFKRMEEPAEVIEVYYDDSDGLAARGIDTRRQVHVTPDAFPRDQQEGCEPPTNWRP